MVVPLTERVTRVRAPNPSAMTLTGTNSYVVDAGGGQAVAIDPGPRNEAHVEAIAGAAAERGLRIAAIAVTHGHPDHAPGAALLRAHTGAPVYAHAAARFPYDVALADGEPVPAGDASLVALEAPGHAREHLVFHLAPERVLFTGDVVIGSGTVVIAPPGGDMRAYQATLERLRRDYGDAAAIFGGHGERIDDVRGKLDEYIAHREQRERQLVDLLREAGPATIPHAVETLYRNSAPILWPAAARQLMAYLEALEREGRVTSRVLPRPATTTERLMLHPDLSRITDLETRAAIEEELGLSPCDDGVREYELVR